MTRKKKKPDAAPQPPQQQYQLVGLDSIKGAEPPIDLDRGDIIGHDQWASLSPFLKAQFKPID